MHLPDPAGVAFGYFRPPRAKLFWMHNWTAFRYPAAR
jgi:hypothetical protein